MPVFSFRYKVDEQYHSGRFALMAYTVAHHESIIPQLIGRTFPVCYNPGRPDRWFIPDEIIEGYKVRQQLEPHVIGLYYPKG